jgi:hypothetical protein
MKTDETLLPDDHAPATGAECPICAPLERIRLTLRARRQLVALRRKCLRTFAERSQPPERD